MGSIDDMNRFSIKDIENLTGIRAHTIRIWEQRYGILQPKRTPTNIRYYDGEDLKLALRIALLNKYGYKISRIHKMSGEDMSALIQKINDDEFRLQLLVNEMIEAMLAMDTGHFEHLLNSYIKKHGVEQATEQLIFGFLEKLGILWLTDRIFPAQEHLVCHIIYRKLTLALEQLPPSKTDAAPSVLLFLPEGEIHELGLLYVYYLLCKHGKSPIYLGANTPIADARIVYQHKRPEYIYIHITAINNEFDINRYLQKLNINFPTATIFVSGGMVHQIKPHDYPNIRIIHNLAEAKGVLVTLE